MKATVAWAGGKAFSYESESGHKGYMDGAAKDGPGSKGPSPMELILNGLGGCTSYDVVNILQKSRQDVVNCEAQLSAERADTVPAVFTKIHIHFIVTGRQLKPAQVERAIALSAEKYCSASMMLEKGGVVITHDFELVEAD
ncbi:MAG TPA: OsmC family protein [Saccharospirillum sp.]|nr:OsmC family protein [Saccharospirillum sp.]